MNEQAWLASVDPEIMLDLLDQQGAISPRKDILWGCACVRRVWRLLTDDRLLQAVWTAEQHADGLANDQELATARAQAFSALRALQERRTGDATGIAASAAGAAGICSIDAAGEAAYAFGISLVGPEALFETWMEAAAPEFAAQAGLLRDIFGNPFRPIVLVPAWLTPAVVALASAAYDERALPTGELDPARLAVLTDALEEAGCTDEAFLTHLRSPGPHVRGCFALDLILARA
jgi:hypothetical protein